MSEASGKGGFFGKLFGGGKREAAKSSSIDIEEELAREKEYIANLEGLGGSRPGDAEMLNAAKARAQALEQQKQALHGVSDEAAKRQVIQQDYPHEALQQMAKTATAPVRPAIEQKEVAPDFVSKPKPQLRRIMRNPSSIK